MPVFRRVSYIAAIALGFALVIGGGLTALYVVPYLREISDRVLVALAAIAGGLAGLLVIAKCVRALENSGESSDEPHLPGLDVDLEEIEKTAH